MTYCKNCGHESHCGIDYRRPERDWRGKLLGEIVVCQYCRCEDCESKTDELFAEGIVKSTTSWPGPGV